MTRGDEEGRTDPLLATPWSRLPMRFAMGLVAAVLLLGFLCPRITAQAVPLVDLLRTISDQTGVSIIAAEALDAHAVSLEVRSAEIDSVLGAVARRLGQRLTKIGAVYYIGQISPEDRGVLVRRVHRMSGEDLKAMLQLFQSEYGRFTSFSDGLIVAADRVEVLERLSSALDQISSTPSGSWVMQLYFISPSDHLKDNTARRFPSPRRRCQTRAR